MLTPFIESWFTPYRSTAGRRAFSLRKVQALLRAAGYADLAALCDPLIAANLSQLELMRLFRVAQGLPGGSWTPEIIAADITLDRALGDLIQLLEALARRTGTERGDAAKALLEAGFSEGLAYYTQQNFGEEEVRVAGLVALLARHPAKVAATTSADIVADITDAHQKFQTLLVAHEKAERMRFDEVKAADLANQRGYLELIAAILSRTGELPEAERAAARARLLGPVMEQNAAIGELMRLRRAVKDVDPDSGTPEGDSPDST